MGVRKELEEGYDYEIVDEFLDHFAMSTDMIEVLIIQLEKPEYYERNINELFRIFHNTKSAAGYLHLEVIQKFAAVVEEVLEILRKQEGPATPEIVDWLLICDDLMSTWNENLRMDEELAAVPESIKNLPKLES